MEKNSGSSANSLTQNPEIGDLHFLEGNVEDKVAIEFLVTNPTPTEVLIHRAIVSYRDGNIDLLLHLEPPPIYNYELAIRLDINTEHNDKLVINGIAREPTDEWARPISGLVSITRHEDIKIQFSFPLYLKIASKEQGLIRLIMKQPLLVYGKNPDEADPFWVSQELLFWTTRQGHFEIRLEGSFENPIAKAMNDNGFLKHMASLSMHKMGSPIDKSSKYQSEGEKDLEASWPPMRSILFVAADPTDASRLRLGEEFREIQERLRLAKLRDRFRLELPQLSVRPADLSQALLDVHPHIVHFSGHGSSTGALCFENQGGQIQPVRPEALAALFEQFANQVNCVLLNACYSEAQAKAIANYIEYVIGMNQAIGDKAAIAFTTGFYQALGAGCTIEEAYKLGCVQIRLQDSPEHLTPILINGSISRSDITWIADVIERIDLPSEILGKLADDPSDEVKIAVLRHNNCPKKVLVRYAQHENAKLRQVISKRHDLPQEIIDTLVEKNRQALKKHTFLNGICPRCGCSTKFVEYFGSDCKDF
jgi:hypothetical protein